MLGQRFEGLKLLSLPISSDNNNTDFPVTVNRHFWKQEKN